MSDNEDLLGDDLGDHSLADYNLGNEEEDQLLADDYESGLSQNVPSSVAYEEAAEAPPQFSEPEVQYPKQRIQYHLQPDTGESVVPNITVEVSNVPERPSYAPYEPPTYQEQAVPPAMPAAPIEPPQIVPSDQSDQPGRERFTSERPVGAQRTPQQRDIPDSLDKVIVPRGGAGGGWGAGGGGGGRGRTTWRNPHYHQRFHNQFRRNNVYRGNFNQRPSFPPPQQLRASPPQIRPEIRPNPPQMRQETRPEIPPHIRPELPHNVPPNSMGGPVPPNSMRPDLPLNIQRPDILPNMPPRPDLPPGRPDLSSMREPGVPGLGPELPLRPDFRPELRPDLPPHLPQDLSEGLHPSMPLEPPFRPMERHPFRFQNQFRDERPFLRPNFDPFYRPFRPFPPIREVAPNMNQIPQVTIRHGVPNLPPNMPPNSMGPPNPMGPSGPTMGPGIQQEVRMLPVQLPPVPAGALAGKKVLINPHFKGTFQPPVEGLTLPAYIPTRIQKSPPPLSSTLESKLGPVKDIDDAAERFIAEQRNALARAATRKFPTRRSPQRFIENTTIEIENELARPVGRRKSEDDLLRRQEEFINANRAGLRRRMRSPTPPRRSASPRRSPDRLRARIDTTPHAHAHAHVHPHAHTRTPDEEAEYRRRMREQEALRDRVTRAKEARRRRNAAQHHADKAKREPEPEKDKEPARELPKSQPEPAGEPDTPDTTRKSPEKEPEKIRDRSPIKKDEAEVNSTCEALTPPRAATPALTPPLPTEEKRTDSDDDLDLILEDIDGILSDDDDTGRFKDKAKSKPEPPKPSVDLRSKLPPKPVEKRPPRKPIVFEDKEEKRRRSPQRKANVSSSTREDTKKDVVKPKEKPEPHAKESKLSMRQRITFGKKETGKDKQSPPKEKEKDGQKPQFSNRRVILQRKNEKSVFTRIEVKSDPSKPNPGIFSRAVRTAIGNDKSRIIINKKNDEPEVEYESDSEDDDKVLDEDVSNMALVTNLPHGMTDTRLKTLAGNDVQTLTLDKEDRSAKITFKTTLAAENFKRKFNNKMVAASRLTVVLR